MAHQLRNTEIDSYPLIALKKSERIEREREREREREHDFKSNC